LQKRLINFSTSTAAGETLQRTSTGTLEEGLTHSLQAFSDLSLLKNREFLFKEVQMIRL
jgi:hypothetical protein